jgi:hypothetical protein
VSGTKWGAAGAGGQPPARIDATLRVSAADIEGFRRTTQGLAERAGAVLRQFSELGGQKQAAAIPTPAGAAAMQTTTGAAPAMGLAGVWGAHGITFPDARGWMAGHNKRAQ